MDDEISILFLYLSGFGFSELFLEYFKIRSNVAMISYYYILLFVYMVYPFLDYVNFDFTDSSKPVEFELLLDK